MSYAYLWNDPSYIIVVDDGDTIWGQWNIPFLNGIEAPVTETDKDAFAQVVADFLKSLYPNASVTIHKEVNGAKVDAEFYTAS